MTSNFSIDRTPVASPVLVLEDSRRKGSSYDLRIWVVSEEGKILLGRTSTNTVSPEDFVVAGVAAKSDLQNALSWLNSTAFQSAPSTKLERVDVSVSGGIVASWLEGEKWKCARHHHGTPLARSLRDGILSRLSPDGR
jgi:hypothetical protein